jgi:hypothetical protein
MTPQELVALVERRKAQRKALGALWETYFPDCPTPGNRQFDVWLNRHKENLDLICHGLDKALERAQRREQQGKPMTPAEIASYASGVMLHTEKER